MNILCSFWYIHTQSCSLSSNTEGSCSRCSGTKTSWKKPMLTYRPFLSAFFSRPSITSPSNGRNTTTRNTTWKCADPSPG